MATKLPYQTTEVTEIRSDYEQEGEGTIFKGAPNGDIIAGPVYSPELKAALNQ